MTFAELQDCGDSHYRQGNDRKLPVAIDCACAPACSTAALRKPSGQKQPPGCGYHRTCAELPVSLPTIAGVCALVTALVRN